MNNLYYLNSLNGRIYNNSSKNILINNLILKKNY